MAENEKMDSDGDYLLVVNDLKEYFPISKSLIKSNTVYLKAVDGVSLKLKAGHTIGIVGESGCGKTTLGRTILRLYEPTDGEIIFEGKHIEKLKGNALRKMRPNFQMIFQDPYSSLSPRMTVGEIVGEAVKVHHIVPKEQYKDYIVDIMTKCGLQPHYLDRYPHEFSGGQRQRICIAKALALKPQLVICDEPVSALDVSIQAQIINLFKDLQDSDNLAYLFISHDLSVVEHISDEVGVMYLGNMVEYGTKRDLFDNPLHPYTKALFSAVPVPDPDSKIKRIVLQGDIPSPANPPNGCKFHTRCSDCMSACKLFQPKFTDLGGGHYVACHKYDKKVLDEMSFYDNLCKLEDERNAELDEIKAKKKQKKEDIANKIKELLKIKK
ncbi:MAG TPA: peptide ABC transporter substrate-binding protein [Clostridiales bacterium]|nr:peptide ABC transporter substrate-binding protein [Clostridiales bacterium]HCH92566.1 peptide ABC transporter substrate-binding protein [Clostridiales bacterium]